MTNSSQKQAHQCMKLLNVAPSVIISGRSAWMWQLVLIDYSNLWLWIFPESCVLWMLITCYCYPQTTIRGETLSKSKWAMVPTPKHILNSPIFEEDFYGPISGFIPSTVTLRWPKNQIKETHGHVTVLRGLGRSDLLGKADPFATAKSRDVSDI